ncbi:hypothetical protein LC087_19050 (plasmid) [Bacillus carboniphilus]|uniref:Uncharacterized protein n=1 Tax=Bacillus carboniphilus TaxID=86663 RepID=A0ABY9JYB8_9BACI|nr:hypothetical protein [Bacillus carboniphilus]WLR44406.1 hypothetical protein LC087_19050 [Bacillus carboniphilus]
MDNEKKKKYTDRSFKIVLIILGLISFFWISEENQNLVLISKYTFILFCAIYSLRLFVLDMLNEERNKGSLIFNGLLFLVCLSYFIFSLFVLAIG